MSQSETLEMEQEIERLNEKNAALGRTLHDLTTHVENAPRDAFADPGTVRELLDRAETLIDGEVPAIVERKRELEEENERLRRTLHDIRGRAGKMMTYKTDALGSFECIKKAAESALNNDTNQ